MSERDDCDRMEEERAIIDARPQTSGILDLDTHNAILAKIAQKYDGAPLNPPKVS